MNKVLLLNVNDISSYIKDAINSLKIGNFYVDENCFHHNTPYHLMPSIINHGILSIKNQNDKGITNFTKLELALIDDISSHINGIYDISLSKTNLTDLYRDEFVYDPKNERQIDITIDDIRARRVATHYGNEFICNDYIMPEKFKSIDIRILKLIETINHKENLEELKKLVEKFNYLKQIVIAQNNNKLNIPIREMSYEDNSLLDANKIIDLPTIRIK